MNPTTLPFVLTFAAQTVDKSLLKFQTMRAKITRATKPLRLSDPNAAETDFSRGGPHSVNPRLIYAVDNAPHLTDLYQTFLESAGYLVKTFNHGVNALAALNAEPSKPALLVTNYHGASLPVSLLLEACRLVQPTIRILIASGFDQNQMRFAQTRPDRFLQKPFTPEELQQAISALLADDDQ
jgi:CheY-like chemotaxis protein